MNRLISAAEAFLCLLAIMGNTPAAEAASDGTTTVCMSPEQPKGVPRGNWIQTDPEKGWFIMLRLYSQTEAWFDKTWRPS